MESQIESTEKMTRIDGVEVRAWKGTTASGKKCTVFVHRIAVDLDEEDPEEFDRELLEQLPPGRLVPLSMIL